MCQRRYNYEVYPTIAQLALLLAYERSLRWLWNELLAHVVALIHIEVAPRRRRGEIKEACAHIAGRIDRAKAERELSYAEAVRYNQERRAFILAKGWLKTDDLKKLVRAKTQALHPKMAASISSNAADELALRLIDAIRKHIKIAGIGFPRFKDDRSDPVSISITVKKLFAVKSNRLFFSMFELDSERTGLKFYMHRDLPSEPSSFSLGRDGKRWFVSFVVQVKELEQAPDRAVGLDLGVATMVADSDGALYQPLLRDDLNDKRVKYWSERLSARVYGSKRYEKAHEKRAKYMRKEADRRHTYLHTLSRRYAEDNRTIVVEALKIKNLTASAAGTVDEPGTNVAQKSGLNRSILRQGWATFVIMCMYKLKQRRGELVKVKAQGTSITCRVCRYEDKANRASQASFVCLNPECGHREHADVHAAKNILDRRFTHAVKEKASQRVASVKRRPAGPVVA